MQPIKTVQNRRGDVITTYTKLFPKYARPVLSHELAFNYEFTVVDTVRDMLNNMFIPKHARIRAMIGRGGFGLEGIPTFEFQVDEAISTTFVDKSDLISELDDVIETVMMRYDGNASHLIVNDVTLTVLKPNPNNGAGGQRRTVANTQYLIPGEYQTCENCFYVAWGHLMDPTRFANEYAEWLEGTRQYHPDYKCYASKKKSDMRLAARRVDFPWKNAYVDDAQAEFIVSHTNAAPILRIYDGQFVLKKECIPRNVSFQTPIIEMQRSQNHYRALIPWSKLDDHLKTRIQTALQSKQNRPAELKQARKIRETFKVEAARSRRFVAWDLETTTEDQGALNSPFKTYAAGLAWYRAPFEREKEPVEGVQIGYDGEQEMLYVSFWGMDAIELFIKFLAEHAVYFANATLIAHNAGRFDLPLLMREHLFSYPGATIDGKRCVILNGRWIGFTVTFAQEESIIYFRDSLAMIPGRLADLLDDYKTPHKKLVETVSHDDINLDNWMDHKPQLSQYLQNDCFGLLELMDRFSTEIYDMSYHQKCEKHFGERNSANVLEKLLNIPHMSFRKQRPEWCKNATGQKLELDGLCDGLCAFEFQDEYHYKRDHMFNRKTGYERRVSDDQCKVDICRARNLPLIIVPYWVRHPHKIVAFLKKELTRMEIPHDNCTMSYEEITRDRVLQSGGICLNSPKGRSPMTSAGVAKRLFFNKFYGKYPVYTLTKAQDAYIRASYFGGRVELFQLGVVHGPVFYLDFTSLYPAMGAAHLLPYGDPVLYPTFTNTLPDEFFGFVRCMVTSTPHGRTRTPLHGIKSGTKTGKLLFAHIETPMELTLFSEEIRKGMQEGLYNYQFLDGISFKRGPLMRDANLSLFAMKKQANADGRSACEKVVKQEVNSMYGFWGLRTERRESIKIYTSDDVRDVYSYLAKNALLEESDHGRYTCLRVVDDMDVIDFNVAVAAGITSWARMRLWGLIDDIERRGGRVFSCDTDSITTDLDLSLHSDLMQKYIPDWETASPGTELGSLKCECTAEISKRFKKGGLSGEALQSAMQVERKSETFRPIPFHHPDGTLCNSANKLYALRTRLQTGDEFEICKAKGISKKFGFEDYVNMFDVDNPHPLTDPQQMQFKLGLSAYCTDGGIQPVSKCLVHKETHAIDPTTALALYDKGNVGAETLKVTPLVLHGNGEARPTPEFMRERATGSFDVEESLEWDDLF
jgi:hypothetical protein